MEQTEAHKHEQVEPKKHDPNSFFFFLPEKDEFITQKLYSIRGLY